MDTFNPAKLLLRVFAAAAAMAIVDGARAEGWISEILFNPPGNDLPHEYVELRGRPNFAFRSGTYFVAVEGDANGGPGTIQNVFDLSGQRLGGNGFLVLLQNSNFYSFHPDATVLSNTNGPGFGSGFLSSVRHRGEGSQTDLENNSVTFLLVESTNYPVINMDVDADDDGILDGPAAGWTVLDSVAVLDNDGAGDFGYGRINFRRTNATTVVSGTIVSVTFTPAYVGRAGNTTNWLAGTWVASGTLDGTMPNWRLDNQDTEPFTYANRLLDHIGAPNFLAPGVAGVVARESNSRTDLVEGSPGTDAYTLSLTLPPTGNVTVQISAAGQLQVSTDGGASFGTVRSVILANTSPVSVQVRALDDNIIGPQLIPITHTITATADPAQYPTSSLMPQVKVHVVENDTVLLNELKVNPPGVDDAPYEFIELRGAPNALLTNVFIYVLEGDVELNPGRISRVIDLSGERLGSSGILLIVADGHPYNVPAGARVYLAPGFDQSGGALGNGSISFLLVSCPEPNFAGFDLDGGDKGLLEGLPLGAAILDSVGWLDGDEDDQVYTPAALTQEAGTPDAATRFPGNTNANSAAAWVNGNLEGGNGDSLAYAAGGGSANLGSGTLLTPGSVNNTAPLVIGLTPFSAVIGDPTTPVLTFQIFDAETPADQLAVNVTSSDETIVPNANLALSGSGTVRTLAINPVGVGYANILVTVSDGVMTGVGLVAFAASLDLRGGGRFHTGVSDASAAMAIDREYMFVGDDENQVLRIFSRGNSGPAIVSFDMNPFLGLVDFYDNGLPREIDVEGSTRVGNRIYWIGSHSHSQDADIRTNRARVFATDVSGTGTNAVLTFAGRYDYLKLDLMNWDATNGHGKGSNYYGLVASGDAGADPKALDGSGFNIEGLAMAPGNTNTAYLCFRAPLIPTTNRVKALLVPVTNFAAMAISTAPTPGMARFGAPMEVNLGGRAFRSVEGNSNGYLIVAGPPGLASGAPPSDFRLFTWTGFATNTPQELGASLTHLLPEGMVELPPAPWTSNSTVQLITDSGITIYYNDGIEAKHLPLRQHKKFRSDWVTLGPVVVSPPVIRSVVHAGANCTLTWYAVAGRSYRVQYALSLFEPAWTDVSGDVVATDAFASKVIAIPAGGQRFFRVIIP